MMFSENIHNNRTRDFLINIDVAFVAGAMLDVHFYREQVMGLGRSTSETNNCCFFFSIMDSSDGFS